MKYRIDKSDLFINNKLHPEGSEVDLTKEQTKGIEDFLILVSSPELVSGTSSVAESDSKSHPELVEGSNIKVTKQNNKGNKK